MNIPDETVWAFIESYDNGCCNDSSADFCCTRTALAAVAPQIPATDQTSDGFHTFGELYDHRRALTRAVMLLRPDLAWRSRNHHPDDGPMFDGQFKCGLNLPTGQVSYHYELAHWDEFDGVPELDHGPKWDGHTSQDVVQRLLAWVP